MSIKEKIQAIGIDIEDFIENNKIEINTKYTDNRSVDYFSNDINFILFLKSPSCNKVDDVKSFVFWFWLDGFPVKVIVSECQNELFYLPFPSKERLGIEYIINLNLDEDRVNNPKYFQSINSIKDAVKERISTSFYFKSDASVFIDIKEDFFNQPFDKNKIENYRGNDNAFVKYVHKYDDKTYADISVLRHFSHQNKYYCIGDLYIDEFKISFNKKVMNISFVKKEKQKLAADVSKNVISYKENIVDYLYNPNKFDYLIENIYEAIG